jgi:hypothetical protein
MLAALAAAPTRRLAGTRRASVPLPATPDNARTFCCPRATVAPTATRGSQSLARALRLSRRLQLRRQQKVRYPALRGSRPTHAACQRAAALRTPRSPHASRTAAAAGLSPRARHNPGSSGFSPDPTHKLRFRLGYRFGLTRFLHFAIKLPPSGQKEGNNGKG